MTTDIKNQLRAHYEAMAATQEPVTHLEVMDLLDDPITAKVRPAPRRSRRWIVVAVAVVIAIAAVMPLLLYLRGEEEPVITPPRLPAEVITYTGEDPRRPGDLVGLNPATGDVRTLVDSETLLGNTVSWGFWSSDGRWAAFEILTCGAVDSGYGGIWVTNGVDEPRRLTDRCARDDLEVWEWSPTGAQIVVARHFGDGDVLTLIDPATGDRTDLGKTAGDVTSLAWSPDGTRIAYGAIPAGTVDGNAAPGEASLHLVAVDGGEHTVLADSLETIPGDEEGAGIRWSPDGERIAVVTEGDVNRLYLLNADGSGLELVTDEVSVEHILGSPGVVWSPDGTRLAYAWMFAERTGLQIWNASIDGSPPILVFESRLGYIAELAGGPVWSPDGTEIAFRYSPIAERAWLVTNADGTGEAREIDKLQYMTWRGGWYFCECYG